ncbi:hypothetical protein NKY66_11155 [Sinorhizobium meliloti]|uniref:hypothetical protein n=1 Tax=Rhizobium meliloti TaxID=382 RepID=UPI003D652CD9
MQNTFAISAANIEILQALLNDASATGEIEAGALRTMADTIVREVRMHETADYLATKSIRPIEKARVGKLMKSMTVRSRHQLDELADRYKRGDLPQMIAALQGLPLSDGETRLVKAVVQEMNAGRDPAPLRWGNLSSILAKHGVNPELKTVRVELPEEGKKSDRTSLANFLPMPA